MKYHFKIYKEKRGCWAECVELSGCITQAENLEKLKKSMQEALNLYLSEPKDSRVIFPKPQKKLPSKKNIVAVPVDPRVAFAMTMRQLRIKKNQTQRQMMAFLGIKNLSTYQRFEDPKKANPELITLTKIKELLPEFSVEQLF